MLTLQNLQYVKLWELNEPSYKSYSICVVKILQLARKVWVHLQAALMGSSEVWRKGTMFLEENTSYSLLLSANT